MKPFRNLKIRSKLFLLFSILISILVITTGLLIWSEMRSVVRDGITRQLTEANASIRNMIRTSLDANIRSHLSATGLHNHEILERLHGNVLAGRMTRAVAQQMAKDILLSQKIGKSGYIYCLSSSGTIVIHPKAALVGKNLTEHSFIRNQLKLKSGYLAYRWQNPDDREKRNKVLYMTYFKPWDWIISVSAYRDEFVHLINFRDLKKVVLGLSFGKTGYPYIIDVKGNLLIHPVLPLRNYFNERDARGKYFIREMIRKKNGSMIYDWNNPGEPRAREKIVFYTTIHEPDWIIVSTGYTGELYAQLRRTSHLVWVIALISILLAAVTSALLSTYITTPLRGMIQNFRMGSDGKHDLRMEVRSTDELGELTLYFNSFMEKLNEIKDKDRQLLEAQKLEIMTTLAGGLAHDFNNYLNGILASVAILERDSDRKKYTETVLIEKQTGLIRNCATNAAELVNQLLDFGRNHDPVFKTSDLNDVLRRSTRLAKVIVDESVRIEQKYSEGQALSCLDPIQIEQVFINLFLNASHAMTIMRPEDGSWGGVITATVDFDPRTGGGNGRISESGYWRVTVSDNGVGMDSGTLARVFDPFYSTKQTLGQGSGLGLTMVRNIIENHGGYISIDSEPGVGSVFSVYLPSCRGLKDDQTEESAVTEVSICAGSGVLVIDDNQMIRSLAESFLPEYGFHVTTAIDAESGVNLFEENTDEIQLIILDMLLPGMNGDRVFRRLREIKPAVPIILVSGFRNDSRIDDLVRMRNTAFVQKPFYIKDLVDIIKSLHPGN